MTALVSGLIAIGIIAAIYTLTWCVVELASVIETRTNASLNQTLGNVAQTSDGGVQ